MEPLVSDWRCNECDTPFQFVGDMASARCPTCQGSNLTRFLGLDEHGTGSEHLGLKCKDPSLPSGRKLRREVRTGRRLEGSGSGRLVDEFRVVDADGDIYIERIIDVQTGRVLRDIEEPLSRHRGGSDGDRGSK